MKLKKAYQHFEDLFRILAKKGQKGPVSLETVSPLIGGNGRVFAFIFLFLSFGQIPGVAFLVGPLVSYLGFRIALGKDFHLAPHFLFKKKVPAKLILKLNQQILKLLTFLKKWTYPRKLWAIEKPATRWINGLMIVFVGIAFTISPPVPLSSLIAFVAIFALAIGVLNEDSLYLLLGYLCTLLYLAEVTFLLKLFSF